MTQIFKVGDQDPYIANIQQALNEKLGAGGPAGLPTKAYLTNDGGFGPKTRDCLMAFQSSVGLNASGVYDTKTQASLDPYIELRFLTESDYVNAAQFLNTEVACVKAVTDVESKDWGFLPNGKPIILFERHHFRNQLLKLMRASTQTALQVAKAVGVGVAAVAPDINLIDQTMIIVNGDIYSDKTGGYQGGIAEYTRLEKAKAFNSTCAIAATSWGMFQIMGFNFSSTGYSTVEKMVEDAYVSEDNQLRQFCSFLKSETNLLLALRSKDWTKLALGYNGPNMKINAYDDKLRAAYNKYLHA